MSCIVYMHVWGANLKDAYDNCNSYISLHMAGNWKISYTAQNDKEGKYIFYVNPVNK